MSNVRPWFRLASIARPTSQGSSDPPPPPPPQPRQTPSRQVVVRQPAKQPSPPRQQQPPSPPRQQRPPSPPRRQQPPSPPRQPTSSPRQQTPPPPPPQERSPYHSPPSRHMSPPTPPKAKSPSPPSPPPRSSYTPPPSPKEVQEALPPRKPTSPPSPAHSTRSLKSEPDSFQKAPSPRVLSPYSLPPPQLHSERETTQKNILTAEKTSQLQEPNHHNQNHNHNYDHQGNNTKRTHHQQPFSGSENIMGTRAITIAGENKGAVMEILRSPSSNKTGGSGRHPSIGFGGPGEKGRRLQSSSSSSSSDEGEGKKKTTKNHTNNANNSNLPMKAFMNSNVQMINNSLVYNSLATHHDPGVHLKISRKPGSGNGFHVKDYGNNDGGYTN
ncbi:unnamed protein product [Eruca vesicaria subsp. sativa]|uniref:Uncharacterized protein n=1 Tax=Eruca vesicaria subsp. sativa TaxID=29727 RepID=A0ABC8IR89_ERUVS|nr:unnamed protein product [Eruca vesicaria subsp. sativa]